MPRFRLIVEYDGTDYFGWQRQDGLKSVQQALETAIFQFCGETITLTTAGRTDAGVHATAQVAHVDLQKDQRTDTVRDAVNAHLQMNHEQIAVLAVDKVDDTFNARFSAIRRHYRYIILNRRAPSVLHKNRVWWMPRPLDVQAMQEAAQRLLGRHDFTTFRAAQCQAASPVRTLEKLDVTRMGERIEIYTCARSFLHNQVRSFAGSLMEVGVGRWNADDLEAALHARDRSCCGMVAPASGLYLTGVDYDEFSSRDIGEKFDLHL